MSKPDPILIPHGDPWMAVFIAPTLDQDASTLFVRLPEATAIVQIKMVVEPLPVPLEVPTVRPPYAHELPAIIKTIQEGNFLTNPPA